MHGLTVTLVDLPNDIFYPHRDLSAPIITVTLTVFLWDFHSESVRHTGIFEHPQWLCVTITVTLTDFHSMILCESQSNWLCVAFTMTLCNLHALTMILHDLTMILCIPHRDSCDTVNYVTFKWLCDTDNDLFWSSEGFYVSSQWISVALQWLFIQSKWLLCDFDNKYGCMHNEPVWIMHNESVWISHWLVTFTDSLTPLAWYCVPSQLLCMTLTKSCVPLVWLETNFTMMLSDSHKKLYGLTMTLFSFTLTLYELQNDSWWPSQWFYVQNDFLCPSQWLLWCRQWLSVT